ncbi:hypothetical protein [Paenibacillus tyrfis]|uniref:hypothetical protein n=1 Tax=Paenibacillus tyrfis TaxID=1501230 RepID=UPI000B58C534|nr:hypothetical protein [Paenibacillus tyrfis]
MKKSAGQAMKKAWEIFKAAGIRTMKAWSVALKKAWQIVKRAEKLVEITLAKIGRTGKAWVAEITGLSKHYKFARTFLTGAIVNEWGFNNQSLRFELEKGKLYQIEDHHSKPHFVVFEGDEMKEIPESSVAFWLEVQAC